MKSQLLVRLFAYAALCCALVPSAAFARTYNCNCINKANHLVQPEFQVEARCGIDANKAAAKKCKAQGYIGGSCTSWEDEFACESEADFEAAVEAELLEYLLLQNEE